VYEKSKTYQPAPWSRSEVATLWVLRFFMFAIPTLAAYGAWVFSGHFFASETPFERVMYWMGTLSGLGFLLMLLQFVAIDLPRAKRRARFWAEKKSVTDPAKHQ